MEKKTSTLGDGTDDGGSDEEHRGSKGSNVIESVPKTKSDKAASLVRDFETIMGSLPRLSISTASLNHQKMKPSRCWACGKRLGLLGFWCRYCEYSFCEIHRHTEDHACDVNLKRLSRLALADRNPVVKSDKLEFRI